MLWHLLQTTDSFFPTGAFAHSGGLEGLSAEAGLKTADDAERALREILERSFARVDLPAFGLAHRAAAEGDVARLLEIDARLEVLKAPQEARQASRSLGRRRLRATAGIEAYGRRVEADGTPGHQAVVAGVHTAVAGVPRGEAMTAFLYGAAAALLAAAMKLLPLGQTRAQGLLARIGEGAPAVVEKADGLGLDDLGSFTPLLDIAAMRHEVSNARLFIS